MKVAREYGGLSIFIAATATTDVATPASLVRGSLIRPQGIIAVTRISMRIVGNPRAATPISVQIGAWSGMYCR